MRWIERPNDVFLLASGSVIVGDVRPARVEFGASPGVWVGKLHLPGRAKFDPRGRDVGGVKALVETGFAKWCAEAGLS